LVRHAVAADSTFERNAPGRYSTPRRFVPVRSDCAAFFCPRWVAGAMIKAGVSGRDRQYRVDHSATPS
jgi:hypothetical protein